MTRFWLVASHLLLCLAISGPCRGASGLERSQAANATRFRLAADYVATNSLTCADLAADAEVLRAYRSVARKASKRLQSRLSPEEFARLKRSVALLRLRCSQPCLSEPSCPSPSSKQLRVVLPPPKNVTEGLVQAALRLSNSLSLAERYGEQVRTALGPAHPWAPVGTTAARGFLGVFTSSSTAGGEACVEDAPAGSSLAAAACPLLQSPVTVADTSSALVAAPAAPRSEPREVIWCSNDQACPSGTGCSAQGVCRALCPLVPGDNPKGCYNPTLCACPSGMPCDVLNGLCKVPCNGLDYVSGVPGCSKASTSGAVCGCAPNAGCDPAGRCRLLCDRGQSCVSAALGCAINRLCMPICSAVPGCNPRGCANPTTCACPSGMTCDPSDGLCKNTCGGSKGAGLPGCSRASTSGAICACPADTYCDTDGVCKVDCRDYYFPSNRDCSSKSAPCICRPGLYDTPFYCAVSGTGVGKCTTECKKTYSSWTCNAQSPDLLCGCPPGRPCNEFGTCELICPTMGGNVKCPDQCRCSSGTFCSGFGTCKPLCKPDFSTGRCDSQTNTCTCPGGTTCDQSKCKPPCNGSNGPCTTECLCPKITTSDDFCIANTSHPRFGKCKPLCDGTIGPCGAECYCASGERCTQHYNFDTEKYEPGNTCEEIPGSDCFPADGKAFVEGVGEVRMDQLRIGDRALTRNAAGELAFQPVMYFGHQDDQLATMVVLEVAVPAVPAGPASNTSSTAGAAGGDIRTLRASKRHYLPVLTRDQDGRQRVVHRHAQDVAPGDRLLLVDGGSGWSGEGQVVRMYLKMLPGRYNPFTEGGFIVVDGVLASTHASFVLDPFTPASLRHFLPHIYQAGHAPWRSLYHFLGPQHMATFNRIILVPLVDLLLGWAKATAGAVMLTGIAASPLALLAGAACAVPFGMAFLLWVALAGLGWPALLVWLALLCWAAVRLLRAGKLVTCLGLRLVLQAACAAGRAEWGLCVKRGSRRAVPDLGVMCRQLARHYSC